MKQGLIFVLVLRLYLDTLASSQIKSMTTKSTNFSQTTSSCSTIGDLNSYANPTTMITTTQKTRLPKTTTNVSRTISPSTPNNNESIKNRSIHGTSTPSDASSIDRTSGATSKSKFMSTISESISNKSIMTTTNIHSTSMSSNASIDQTSEATSKSKSMPTISASIYSSDPTVSTSTSRKITSTGSLTPPASSAAVTTPRTTQSPILIIDVSLKFQNRFFYKELSDKNSLLFIETKKDVENEINIAYNETETFVSAIITGFRDGSLVCDGLLYFKNASKSDIPVLEKTLKKNNGGFTVSEFDINARDDDKDESDDEIILGLDWWQIGVIIGGIVVFILIITVIVLCCKISKAKKRNNDNLSPYMTGPFYDVIDNNNEEMKTLRASPTSPASRSSDVEHGQRGINMYLSTSTTGAKSDALVLKTTSKVGEVNAGADVDENDYVTILDANPGSGDVMKL